MATKTRKPSDRLKSREVAIGKATGKQPENEHLRKEPVDLIQPESEQETQAQAGEQVLLPHERDETTRPESTSQGNENALSQAVIGQASEDTKRGLKDTDRRGIPSDIVGANTNGLNVPEQARKKKRRQ